MERNMEMVNSFGQIKVLILVSFLTTILKEQVFMNGQMEEYLTENGKLIKCKDMEHSLGQMEENMSGNTLMI